MASGDIPGINPDWGRTIQGVDSVLFTTPTNIAVNPSTHAMLVEASGGGGLSVQYEDGDATPTHPIGNALVFGETGSGDWNYVTSNNGLPVSHTGPIGAQITSPIGSQVAGQSVSVVMASNYNSLIVEGLGTPGSSSGNVLTIQGVTAMTPVIVDQGTSPWVVSGSFTPSGTQDVNLTEVGGSAFALGQQLDAASLPVVLTASQISTLTPLSTVAVTQSTSPWVISGTVTANAGTNLNTSALLTTTDFNNSFGTAGSADTQVRTIQGIASMTPVQVSQATAANLNMTEASASSILTSVQLLDDMIIADDAAFTPATTKVAMAGFFADEASTDSVDEGDGGAARMTLDRKQIVTVQPHTTGGLSTMNATSSDGGTALTNSAQVIKATAGQVYGWYIYNPNSSAQFVQFYNTAAASVTVGTTNPLFMLTIPATSAANVNFVQGITFTNTGFSWAATSTAGGNGAPSTALDAVCFYS